MVGHPKHVQKALDVGVDLICAQGGEGGGHTGKTAFSILIPACVDICKGKKSPLTGGPVGHDRYAKSEGVDGIGTCHCCGRDLRRERTGFGVDVWCAGGLGRYPLCC